MYKIGDKVMVTANTLTESIDKTYTVTNTLIGFVEVSDGVVKKLLPESMLKLVK